MSNSLPFDPDKVAAAAAAQAHPISLTGETHDDPPPDDDDTIIPFTPPTVTEGIIPLGYNNATFFYLSRASRQVHTLSAEQHTAKAFMAMASLAHYWQRTNFVTEKLHIQWDQVAGWMMAECHKIGIYNPDRVRGRGAWFDEGRAVLHLGDRLLVNDQYFPLILPGSSAIYPAALPLSLENAPPISNAAANQIIAITAALRWQRPISATLLSGWIVCALVCGALKWRPSIWLTGSSGVGKSFVQDDILAPLVGPVALQVQSKTSEAGIRHTLNSDALPVIFDEFEREDNAAAVRVQGVLDLMRQSSSESEKKIIKGTQQQTSGRSYRIRSCFAFSSINVGLAHAADESRVTVLTLTAPPQGPEAQAAFTALAARAAELFTPTYAAGLLARSVNLLPTIRANAETFAVAVAGRLGTRRLGDQLGTLLAGAYSLYSSRAVTPDEAKDYLDRQDWGDATTTDQQRDEERLLSHLTAHRVRVSLGNGPTMEVTIGRLLNAAFASDERIPADTAANELRDYGIRTYPINPRGAWVSTNHPSLKKALAGTPWEANWSRTLSRLPGAESTQKNVRFGLGHQSKATWIPLGTMDPSDGTSD